VALDPQRLEIMACPEDKGPLLYFVDESALYNPRLKRRYAVRDDIPIMLIDEAETVNETEHERLTPRRRPTGHPTFAAERRVVTDRCWVLDRSRACRSSSRRARSRGRGIHACDLPGPSPCATSSCSAWGDRGSRATSSTS
jgi:uncharacterized protein YbaR (Trm112 family)